MENQTYPEAAYVLSLLGGMFILIGGMILVPVLIGVFGIICAIIVLYSAFNLKQDPSNHVFAGIVIILFSGLSWIGALGGLFIGFLLGFIGGILAVIWAPVSTVGPGASHGDKICPVCSNMIPEMNTYCPECGAQLGQQ